MTTSLGAEELFLERTFTKLSVEPPTVKGRRFEDCQFVDCSWSESSFRSCSFVRCVFDACDLSNWQVDGLRLVEVQFNACKLIGIDWTDLNTDPLTSFHFKECRLDYSDFSRRKAKGIRLYHCSLLGVRFERTDLREADCRDSDLTDAVFDDTNLSKADLRGAQAYAIDLTKNRVQGLRVSLPDTIALLTVAGLVVD